MKNYITSIVGTIALITVFWIPGTALGQESAAGDCCKTAPAAATESDAGGCEKCNTATTQQAQQSGKRGAKMQGEKGGKMGGGPKGVMQGAHTLVMNHGSLTREIVEIPGGVRTTSTTTDPKMVAVLQSHPREMDQHLSDGGKVRQWDPFFVEIAKYHDKIDMKFRNLDNGIEVISTSDDPKAVELIRAHARRVSDFVARGREAAHETTPLPEGYSDSK